MSDPFQGLVVVPSGPGAYDRAMREAIQRYGLTVELNSVGWDGDGEAYEIVEAE